MSKTAQAPRAQGEPQVVRYVRFTHPVLLPGYGAAGAQIEFTAGEPMKEFMGGSLIQPPEMRLDGDFLVIGTRRFSVHGPLIHSFEV